jgi:hypothetical protein
MSATNKIDANITKPADEGRYKTAIAAGKAAIAKGGTKADASRAIFDLIKKESREVIVSALVAGAGLTDKGAMTYYYNLIRKANQGKTAKDSAKAVVSENKS